MPTKSTVTVGSQITVTKGCTSLERQMIGKHYAVTGVTSNSVIQIHNPGGVTTLNRNMGDDWELHLKTLDNLIVNDTVLDEDGDEVKILAVAAPGVYLLSECTDHDEADEWLTAKQMERAGYTIKQEAGEPPREVTMAEVIEKFGQDVVIKKDDA